MIQAFILIAWLIFAAYGCLILYCRASWLKIPHFKNPVEFQPGTQVTIIIPARNEAENIKACLDSIAQQSYPKEMYEVLVVDDHSTDDTASIVKNYGKPVTLISLEQYTHGRELNSYKKMAIEVALKQSNGSLIICTDADCSMSKNWLMNIVACYEQKQASFIVMPVSYDCNASFLQIFQALDFMVLQGITGAMVQQKKLSMCNGANLAYTKAAFNAVEGFQGINEIASGDDMLLMHKIYLHNSNGVVYLKTPEVTVQTLPMPDLRSFINQRIRWASKAGIYKDKRITAVLFLVYIFNLVFLILPFATLFYPNSFNVFGWESTLLQNWLWLLLFKTLVELYFLYPVAEFFNKKTLLWLFPLMQPFHIIYTLVAGWLGKFSRYTWKERRVK